MKPKFLLLLCLPVALGGGMYLFQTLQADIPQAVQAELVSQARTQDTEDLEALNQVLKTYVSDDGLVDYLGLQSDRAKLDAYNASIGLLTAETFEAWTSEQQIAYLLNAYNALTLKSIIDEEPIKASIKDILGVWKVQRHPLMQRQITLDGIEHDILRVNYDEPRIHAALVCAALSCPSLRTEAYEGDRLNEQLDDQVRRFLQRNEAFKLDREKKEVQLSQIFNWFGQDWIPQYGVESGFTGNAQQRAVLNFISQYLSPADQDFLEGGDYQITYSNYDWSLNRQR